MKKFVLLIVLSFYLLSVSGATVYLHFCKGEAKELSFLSPGQIDCPLCNKKKESKTSDCKHSDQKSCCEDVQIDTKHTDDTYHVNMTKSADAFMPCVIVLHWIFNYYNYPVDDNTHLQSNYLLSSSKLLSGSVYLRNQNFRI